MISILEILTGGGGGSKILKIRLTSFVHGPLAHFSLEINCRPHLLRHRNYLCLASVARDTGICCRRRHGTRYSRSTNILSHLLTYSLKYHNDLVNRGAKAESAQTKYNFLRLLCKSTQLRVFALITLPLLRL